MARIEASWERPGLLQLALYAIALHSFLTGVGLLLQPAGLIAWGGWPEITDPFFPAQGGVFHVLMALLYALAARRAEALRLLLPFIVTVKFAAAVFLVGYYLCIQPVWLVLASGLLDGAMGAALLLFPHRIHAATTSKSTVQQC
jgi:hypothetical protein